MGSWQTEYSTSELLVDQVVEWIALKWTKAMMKDYLRKYVDVNLKNHTVVHLIKLANKQIRELYGIDPAEYKGRQIAFYEAVIRGRLPGHKTGGVPSKVKDKLVAAERLDKLYGLEQISNIDPAQLAEQVIAFKRQAEQTVGNGGGDKPINQSNQPSQSKTNEESGDERCEDARCSKDETDYAQPRSRGEQVCTGDDSQRRVGEKCSESMQSDGQSGQDATIKSKHNKPNKAAKSIPIDDEIEMSSEDILRELGY